MDIPIYLLHTRIFSLATLKPCNMTFKAVKMCCRSSAQLTMNTNCRKNNLPRAGGQKLNQQAPKFHHGTADDNLSERRYLPNLNKTGG